MKQKTYTIDVRVTQRLRVTVTVDENDGPNLLMEAYNRAVVAYRHGVVSGLISEDVETVAGSHDLIKTRELKNDTEEDAT